MGPLCCPMPSWICVNTLIPCPGVVDKEGADTDGVHSSSQSPSERDKHSFAGCWYLLNVILDQFVDCKFIIHYYTQFTVHKLVQNYFSYCIILKSGSI